MTSAYYGVGREYVVYSECYMHFHEHTNDSEK